MLRIIIMMMCFLMASHAWAYDPVPDPHYCKPNKTCKYNAAIHFAEWGQLSAKQMLLLGEFITDILSSTDPRIAFRDWAELHDGLAATFLALTRSLEIMEIDLGRGEYAMGIDLVKKINRLEGDRVRVEFDPVLYAQWKAAGAYFKIALTNGKVETGHFRFGKGNLGGSLHHGYDEQGYTSVTQMPRLQINYRNSDHEADVDLDGYAPWIGGWIPDPFHLTWENSDVRQWYGKFVKKFGDAGFSIVKVKFKPQGVDD